MVCRVQTRLDACWRRATTCVAKSRDAARTSACATAGNSQECEVKRFNPYCPARNVTKHYPPTLLLHGDADTDVPFSQSEQMASELKRRDVGHELIRIPGGPHGFDGRMNDPLAAEAFAKVLIFLNRLLG